MLLPAKEILTNKQQCTYDIVLEAQAALSHSSDGLNAVITKTSNKVILKGTISGHFNAE